MRWIVGLWIGWSAFLLAVADAGAQSRVDTLRGRVVAEDGSPVEAAQVVVLPAGRRVITDSEGRFTVANIAVGRQSVQVSRVGYAPASTLVSLPLAAAQEEVRIVLAATALALEALQVTATPGGRDALLVTQATAQLSGRALERELGGTLAETLRQQPGLAVRSMGPGATAPVMRGLTGDRVLVLQDGQRAADLSGSADDHGVTIDPLVAQRIEIVRGPATLLYGNNAVGGVVNVISDDVALQVPTRAQWVAGAQTETAYPGASGSLRGVLPLSPRWALTVRGGARGTGDMRIPNDSLLGRRLQNTDARNAYGALGAGYVGERGSAGAVLRAYDFEYGLPSPPGGDPVRIRGRRTEGSARAERELDGPFASARVDATLQDYGHDELEAASGDVQQAFGLRTGTANLLLRQRRAGPVAEGAWGVSFLGKEYTVTGDAALTPAARSYSYGIFGFQEVALGADGAALQIGGRVDDYRIASRASETFGPGVERRFQAFSSSLGVRVRLAEGVSAGVNVARSFRAPTVEELFSGAAHAGTGSVELGDAALRAERGRSVEGVLRVRNVRWTAQAALFQNTIQNYVFLAARGDSLVGGALLPVLAYTQATATLRGAEGSAEWTAGRHLVLGLMGDVLHAARADGTPLSYMPPARLGGALRWEGGVFSVGGDLHQEFAQRRTGAADELPTDAHLVLRVHGGVRIQHGARVHSLQLRAENLTNALHREATSRTKDFAPGPGRSVALLYRVYF